MEAIWPIFLVRDFLQKWLTKPIETKQNAYRLSYLNRNATYVTYIDIDMNRSILSPLCLMSIARWSCEERFVQIYSSVSHDYLVQFGRHR